MGEPSYFSFSIPGCAGSAIRDYVSDVKNRMIGQLREDGVEVTGRALKIVQRVLYEGYYNLLVIEGKIPSLEDACKLYDIVKSKILGE